MLRWGWRLTLSTVAELAVEIQALYVIQGALMSAAMGRKISSYDHPCYPNTNSVYEKRSVNQDNRKVIFFVHNLYICVTPRFYRDKTGPQAWQLSALASRLFRAKTSARSRMASK
jgi:hypothetical protein